MGLRGKGKRSGDQRLTPSGQLTTSYVKKSVGWSREKLLFSVFSDNFPYDHGYIMELTFIFKISQRDGLFSHCHGIGGLSKS